SVQRIARQDGIELLSADSLLPRVTVRIRDVGTLGRVRRLGFVDYLEPNAGGFQYLSGSSGCNYSFRSAPAQRTFAGDYMPPHYTRPVAQINLAWNRTRGDGVILGLADTGISEWQEDLISLFAVGASAGRWYSYHGVQARPWYATDCSHGTRMASAMAAGMNGVGTVGVAWRSHLVSAHQDGKVFSVDTDDVVDGLRYAAGMNSAVSPRRVVAMAFQADNWYNSVSDEVRYWHYNGRLFVAAAGTVDYGGVAFPADMAEVVAVSAVGSNMEELSGLNYGSKVEVSFYEGQLVNGKYTSDLVDLGGSSGATAVVAGQAALIWAYYPAESNVQIRDRLRRAGHQYPNHDRVKGYGIVNVMRAVGGMYAVNIPPPRVVGGGGGTATVYEIEALTVGGDGPFTYRWNTGETTRVIRYSMDAGDAPRTYTVTVSDADPYGTTVQQSSIPVTGPEWDCEQPTLPGMPPPVC
ncbi:MAG TPA: S8/S53 family peptidase, partial [Longimicrobium sp.]|nr:S8/S53 family peptidase [Longimicrobium sp.]